MHRAARPLSAAHGPGATSDYYEDTHLPLVAQLPGLRGYRYSFDVAAAAGESPYFCVFEADFDVDDRPHRDRPRPRQSAGDRPEKAARRRACAYPDSTQKTDAARSPTAGL